MADVACPVYVISGAVDRHTTASETHAMFSAARPLKELWLVNDAAHVDLLNVAPLEYQSRIARFFDLYLHAETEKGSEPSIPWESWQWHF